MTRALILNAVSTPEQARKISLKLQDELARQYCSAQGLQVIESLFSDTSRSKYDRIDDIILHNPAFAKLWEHINARDFDWLIVHSFDRLARDAALIVFLIQRVIRSGARIYALQGGEVNEGNYLALCGAIAFMVAAPIRAFVEKAQATKTDQARQGIHAQGRPLMTNRIIRDARGNRVGMALNEDVRPLIELVVQLVCDRNIAWRQLGGVLESEFKIVNPTTNKAWHGQNFYRLFMNPEFWGHTARHYSLQVRKERSARFYTGWSFDPALPPPQGVQMFYDTHTPFLQGELAEKLKAKLRQAFSQYGKARHGKPPSPAAGLLICAHCGNTLAWHRNSKLLVSGETRYYTLAKCEWRYMRPPGCTATTRIYEAPVLASLDQRLRELISARDLAVISPADRAAQSAALNELRTSIAATERELSGLLRDKANASDPDLLATYNELITDAHSKLKKLRSTLGAAQSHLMTDDQQHERTKALQELIDLTVDGLWNLPALEANRLLHRLFGKYRLVVDGDTIIGIAEGKQIKRV